MSQLFQLTPALQSNIAVVAQYDFLFCNQQQPKYGVYEGQLFICSQKTNTWFQYISQIFYNVIRNLWYKSSIDYEEEQILPLLNEVRSYHTFKAMQIDKATLESLEGKMTAARKELSDLEKQRADSNGNIAALVNNGEFSVEQAITNELGRLTQALADVTSKYEKLVALFKDMQFELPVFEVTNPELNVQRRLIEAGVTGLNFNLEDDQQMLFNMVGGPNMANNIKEMLETISNFTGQAPAANPTPPQKPESPTLQSEGKTPNGWVKQMAEARDGFRKDLSIKEEDLKRKEEQLGIAKTLINTLKGQIQPLETENARLSSVIKALKAFVKTFQTDLAVIDSKDNQYVTKCLDQLGLTDLLDLDLTATEEVKRLILAERLALSLVDD